MKTGNKNQNTAIFVTPDNFNAVADSYLNNMAEKYAQEIFKLMVHNYSMVEHGHNKNVFPVVGYLDGGVVCCEKQLIALFNKSGWDINLERLERPDRIMFTVKISEFKNLPEGEGRYVYVGDNEVLAKIGVEVV